MCRLYHKDYPISPILHLCSLIFGSRSRSPPTSPQRAPNLGQPRLPGVPQAACSASFSQGKNYSLSKIPHLSELSHHLRPSLFYLPAPPPPRFPAPAPRHQLACLEEKAQLVRRLMAPLQGLCSQMGTSHTISSLCP